MSRMRGGCSMCEPVHSLYLALPVFLLRSLRLFLSAPPFVFLSFCLFSLRAIIEALEEVRQSGNHQRGDLQFSPYAIRLLDLGETTMARRFTVPRRGAATGLARLLAQQQNYRPQRFWYVDADAFFQYSNDIYAPIFPHSARHIIPTTRPAQHSPHLQSTDL